MRLKSLQISTAATNQRLKTCVGNMFMLCLLSSQVWSYANIKQRRFVRQLNDETLVNYEDSSMTNSHHQPHFTGNRAVLVQLFEWKFLDVAAECRNFLGPQGYAGVQLSPVLEHTVVKTSSLNHPWWERYEVISYRLASRSGDESEFWSMSRICNDHGVRIYADVVLNHMAAPLHFIVEDNESTDNKDFIVNTLLETNVNISQLNYSNVSYTQVDFHRSSCAVLANTQDAHEIRNCQLNGHPDLDHSRAGVQKHIVQMLNKFIDMGVAGFRIDTAKYIWPIDLKNILKQVKNLSTEFNFKKNSRPFVYHDVFDLGLDTVSKTEYSTYGVVSEYLYAAELATIFNRKVSLSSLINWGPALGFLPHEDSLVFIDSHDTQRGLPKQLGNNHLLTYKQRIKYIMANVFMLIHPYGAIKRIMSSYYFPDMNINQGPPVEDEEEGEEIRSPKFNSQQQCTKESGWVCEHRWPAFVNMLKVANYFKASGQEERSIIYFQSNGANQVAFCRGYKAFVAINNDPEMDFEKEVYACLEPGTYCDMVTGGKKEGEEKCQGKMLVINEQRYTKLHLAVADDGHGGDYEQENEEESGRIESYGILVIYVESKIQPKEELLANGEGKDDKEIKPEADNQQPPGIDENLGEGKAEATDLEETGDDNDTEDTDDQKDNQADEGTELKETGADDNDTDNTADQTDDQAEEDIDNPNEGEEEEINTVAEHPEGNDIEKSKEEGDANENQPEVNEEADVEVADNDANDGQEAGKPDETIETPSEGQEEQEETNDEQLKAGEEGDTEDDGQKSIETPNEVQEEQGETNAEEQDKEKASAENEIDEEGNSNNKEGEGNSKETVEGEEADANDDPTKGHDEPEGIENEEPADKKDENPNEEKADENDEEPADKADENQSEEKADEQNKANEEESNKEENDDETERKEPQQEPLVNENSLEIIAAEASVEQQAENVAEEPEIEVVTVEDNTEHNQSRNIDEKNTEAEEQVEKPIGEIVDDISETTDAVTAKVQDIQTAGIFSKPKGGGNNG